MHGRAEYKVKNAVTPLSPPPIHKDDALYLLTLQKCHQPKKNLSDEERKELENAKQKMPTAFLKLITENFPLERHLIAEHFKATDNFNVPSIFSRKYGLQLANDGSFLLWIEISDLLNALHQTRIITRAVYLTFAKLLPQNRTLRKLGFHAKTSENNIEGYVILLPIKSFDDIPEGFWQEAATQWQRLSWKLIRACTILICDPMVFKTPELMGQELIRYPVTLMSDVPRSADEEKLLAEEDRKKREQYRERKLQKQKNDPQSGDHWIPRKSILKVAGGSQSNYFLNFTEFESLLDFFEKSGIDYEFYDGPKDNLFFETEMRLPKKRKELKDYKSSVVQYIENNAKDKVLIVNHRIMHLQWVLQYITAISSFPPNPYVESVYFGQPFNNARNEPQLFYVLDFDNYVFNQLYSCPEMRELEKNNKIKWGVNKIYVFNKLSDPDDATFDKTILDTLQRVAQICHTVLDPHQGNVAFLSTSSSLFRKEDVVIVELEPPEEYTIKTIKRVVFPPEHQVTAKKYPEYFPHFSLWRQIKTTDNDYKSILPSWREAFMTQLAHMPTTNNVASRYGRTTPAELQAPLTIIAKMQNDLALISRIKEVDKAALIMEIRAIKELIDLGQNLYNAIEVKKTNCDSSQIIAFTKILQQLLPIVTMNSSGDMVDIGHLQNRFAQLAQLYIVFFEITQPSANNNAAFDSIINMLRAFERESSSDVKDAVPVSQNQSNVERKNEVTVPSQQNVLLPSAHAANNNAASDSTINMLRAFERESSSDEKDAVPVSQNQSNVERKNEVTVPSQQNILPPSAYAVASFESAQKRATQPPKQSLETKNESIRMSPKTRF